MNITTDDTICQNDELIAQAKQWFKDSEITREELAGLITTYTCRLARLKAESLLRKEQSKELSAP